MSASSADDRRRLRVALVVSNLEYGGAQRQVVQLARSLDARRFETRICSLSSYVPLADELPELKQRLHVVEKRSRYDVSVVPRLRRWLTETSADIVHGFLFDAQLAARVAGRLAGVPVVIDSERNSEYHMRLVQRLAFRLTRGCVDLVVANSRAGAAFHQRMHGHPAGQYRVVRNGVDTDRFRPRSGVEARRELGLRDDDVVVGMFGSYKPQKNHPLLFEAAARIAARQARLRLLLVGDQLAGGLRDTDAHKQRVAMLVDRLGLAERCVFVGNRLDLERLYGACDVVALPSLYEGTPNVLLESMACGVPVVATDVGDNPYVVPDGRVGFLVPPADAERLADRLERLVQDEALRRRLGAEARRWAVEAFSLERLAAETAAVYEAAWAPHARHGEGRPAAAPRSSAARRAGRVRLLMALPDRRVRGGPPSHLYLLRDSLLEQGIDVRDFLYGGRTHDEGPLRKTLGRLADLARFPVRLWRERPDVLQLNSAFDRKGVARDVFFVPLARLLRQRTVLKFHGSDLPFLERPAGVWRLLSRLVVRGASVVCVLSHEEREAFARLHPGTRVEVVKNALDLSRYRPRYDFRERYGIPRGRPLLLFVARFIESKGLREVLDALARIAPAHDVHAALVGDGPVRAEMESLARALGVAERTTFTGYVAEDETVPAYAAADLLVFPTYHQEGMPMVIFHSLACGLPVVTTRIRAAADWLSGPEQAVFVPPRDPEALARAVVGLLDDPDLRRRMADNGRRVAATFERSAVAREFVELYTSLLAPGRGPAGVGGGGSVPLGSGGNAPAMWR